MGTKALVTGAAGFIGSHLVKYLLEENVEVRAMILPGENTRNIDELDIECVRGDITDRESVKNAVHGCDVVFHLAAIYALWLPRMSLMDEVNIDGTYNVMRAALNEGVERVVHTSSLVVFGGQSPDEDSTEESPFVNGDTRNLYAITKYRSQKIALDFCRKGLDVVVAAPCGPIGPHDIQPTPTGKLLLSLVHMPIVPLIESISNMVDVRDVAKGHVLAWQKGRTGECYILGNENLWASELAQIVMEVAEINRPTMRIPKPLVKIAPHFALAWSNYVSRKPPLIEPSSGIIGERGMRMNCSKAFNELGLPRRPIRESVHDALIWFSRHGYITNAKVRDKFFLM